MNNNCQKYEKILKNKCNLFMTFIVILNVCILKQDFICLNFI